MYIKSTAPRRGGKPAGAGYVGAGVILRRVDLSRGELLALAAGHSPLVRSVRRGRRRAFHWRDALAAAEALGRGVIV
jgi:hypothetical protein